MGTFPLFTLNYFKCSSIIGADMSLEIEWARLLFGLWAWLMVGAISFMFLLPWITRPGEFRALKQVSEALGLVCGRQKK